MKNKKIIALVVLIVVALALGGVVIAITRTQSPAPEEQQEQQQAESEPVAPTAPETTTEEPAEDAAAIAMAMSNHNDEGLFLVVDENVYFSDFGEDGKAMLVRSAVDGTGKVTIREDCDASFLTLYKNRLYMIIWTRQKGPALCSMDLNGGDFQTLVEGAGDLQILDDKLYYNKVDASDMENVVNSGYYTSELDGTGESLLLDKETYDNFVAGDKVYYQDESKGQNIRMIDLKTQEDKQVTKTHSHGFVLDGETGYYIDTGKDSETVTGKLMALDMATGESKVIAESAYRDELIIRKDDILYCDGENNFHITRIDKAGGNRTELLPIDNPDYVYATEKNIMFFDYDAKWEFVEGVFGCGPNGENYTRLDG